MNDIRHFKPRVSLTLPEEMLYYAMRYALGRRTYAVGEIADQIIANVGILSDKFKRYAIRDITEAEKKEGLGDPNIDRPVWLAVCRKLEEKL